MRLLRLALVLICAAAQRQITAPSGLSCNDSAPHLPQQLHGNPPERRAAGFYSQHGQDRYVWDRIFAPLGWPPRGERGVFVEFGARDGVVNSNSLYAERERGWTGVLIEPNTADYARLAETRANGTLKLHGGLCPPSWRGRERDFLLVTPAEGEQCCHGWSQWVDHYNAARDHPRNQLLDAHVASGRLTTRVVPVRCHDINEALARLGTDRVHLLSADCEGCELDALRSLDWGRVKVDVLLVEGAALACPRDAAGGADVEDTGEPSLHRFLARKRFYAVDARTSDTIYVHARVLAELAIRALADERGAGAGDRKRKRRRPRRRLSRLVNGVFS